MNKLIITPWGNQILTALWTDGMVTQLNLESSDGDSLLNRIYIGKVKNVVKNINAAFVEIFPGQMGYYSLTDNKHHLYVNEHPSTHLKEGDEIIVQVVKEAVKTKDPVLSCYLNFAGKYSVLTVNKPQIGISAKITDLEWKTKIKMEVSSCLDPDFGIIIRTNAVETDAAMIQTEVNGLKQCYHKVLEQARYRTCYTVLYQSVPGYIAEIRDAKEADLAEIVTDSDEIYTQLKQYLETYQAGTTAMLRLYQDQLLPLAKLFSIDASVKEALSKRVWLKSGGYLVIEPTEALVVIDVNTGKYSGKKNLRETILKINIEAAIEIAKQICLRNLSGIIIVDFIDMEDQKEKEKLISILVQETRKDPVKVTVLDITKLNLVEMTRKKVKKPFHEQMSYLNNN